MSSISEINKDTFWELIAQAKEQCGQDQDAFCQWLEDRLIEMGPEQALNFDYAAFAYRAAAYKYGLWSAASVMLDGCTDDGFTDFRGWLIAQGRDVYMAALKDPDSLADVPVHGDCCFETICYVITLMRNSLDGTLTKILTPPYPVHGRRRSSRILCMAKGSGIPIPGARLPPTCQNYALNI